MEKYRFGAIIVATHHARPILDRLSKTASPCLTPLQKLISTFLRAGIENITVVMADSVADPIRKQLSHQPVRFLTAPTNVSGAAADAFALTCSALSVVSGQADRIFIAQEDRPFVSVHTIERLMAADHLPVAPLYDGAGGHPLLIDASDVPKLTAVRTDTGMRGALRAAGLHKNTVEVDDDGCMLSLASPLSETALIQRLSEDRVYPSAKIMLSAARVFFGPGAARLLNLIDETGNVREACERMNISYSKSWKILNQIERQTGIRAVARRQGGASGGSAALTAEGRQLLNRYQAFNARCQDAVAAIYAEIFDEPAPAPEAAANQAL